MQSEMVPFHLDVYNVDLRVRFWRGRPCVVAQEFGAVLGYTQPRVLVDKIRRDWKHEFADGADYEVVTGRDVAAAGGGLDSSESLESKNPQRGARALLLLFESGMYLAAVKAHTARGILIRRWLASEVLPAIARTGRYERPAPEPVTVTPAVTLPVTPKRSRSRAFEDPTKDGAWRTCLYRARRAGDTRAVEAIRAEFEANYRPSQGVRLLPAPAPPVPAPHPGELTLTIKRGAELARIAESSGMTPEELAETIIGAHIIQRDAFMLAWKQRRD